MTRTEEFIDGLLRYRKYLKAFKSKTPCFALEIPDHTGKYPLERAYNVEKEIHEDLMEAIELEKPRYERRWIPTAGDFRIPAFRESYYIAMRNRQLSRMPAIKRAFSKLICRIR